MKIVLFSQFTNPNPAVKSLTKICRATRIIKKRFSSGDPLFDGDITIMFPRMNQCQERREFSLMQGKRDSRVTRSIPFN